MNVIIVTDAKPSEIAELVQKLKKRDSAYYAIGPCPSHIEAGGMYSADVDKHPKQFFGGGYY